MLPEDLASFATIDSVDVAPDGTRIAYSQVIMDLAANTYLRALWVSDGEARQLTTGPADKQPRWSPDGNAIAFIRTVDEVDQLAVLTVEDETIELVTDFGLKVISFDWAPDSQRLVAQVREYADTDDLTPEARAEQPWRIAKFPYRFDDPRWEGDTVDHLWIVDRGAEAQRLTSGDAACEGPKWSPDGSEIAFRSDRSGRLFGSSSQHVCVIPSSGGDVATASDLGLFDEVSYRPDGVLHAVGLVDEADWPSPLQLWRLDGDGMVAVAPQIDRSVADVGLSWMGDDAVFAVEDGGKHVVVGVSPSGNATVLYDERGFVRSIAAAAERLAMVGTLYRDPSRVVVITDGRREVWAEPNAGLDIGLVDGDYFQVPSDGYEVDAWVYLPPGTDRVPLLLNIHGGPAGQYGFGFLDEFQMYVGAGYGVVACNPRGSSGRGKAWMRAVTGEGWGLNDLADVQAVVAAALARHDRLDGERKGIMGGSYGGFLTAWATAHDQSYRSAVVERALLNWTSFAGTSDISSSFPGMYITEESMPAGFAELWEASPIRIADRIATPTLIIHAEGDYRCPVEQAEQLFAILLRNGVKVEFVRFRGESHEMSRSGSPRHRLQRFEAILDWHGRYLA